MSCDPKPLLTWPKSVHAVAYESNTIIFRGVNNGDKPAKFTGIYLEFNSKETESGKYSNVLFAHDLWYNVGQAAERQAEEEAQKKAEEEAKKKAEVEAKRKAEEEAKKKAEGEAKKKTEEEAKKQAEEEGLKKAGEDAQKKERKDLAIKEEAKDQTPGTNNATPVPAKDTSVQPGTKNNGVADTATATPKDKFNHIAVSPEPSTDNKLKEVVAVIANNSLMNTWAAVFKSYGTASIAQSDSSSTLELKMINQNHKQMWRLQITNAARPLNGIEIAPGGWIELHLKGLIPDAQIYEVTITEDELEVMSHFKLKARVIAE